MATLAGGCGGGDGGGWDGGNWSRKFPPEDPDIIDLQEEEEEEDAQDDRFLRYCEKCKKHGYLRKHGCANPECVPTSISQSTDVAASCFECQVTAFACFV